MSFTPRNTIYDKCPVYLIFYIINVIITSSDIQVRHTFCNLISKIAHSSTHSYLSTQKYDGDGSSTIAESDYKDFGANTTSDLGDGLRPIRLCSGDDIKLKNLKALTLKETIEFWDDIMKKSLPNILPCDAIGMNLGTYGQFDLFIKYNSLNVAWYMFGKVLKKAKNLSKFSNWIGSLGFVYSKSAKTIQYLPADQLDEIRETRCGRNGTVGDAYTNFDMITYLCDLDALNWNNYESSTYSSKEFNKDDDLVNNINRRNKIIKTQATNSGIGVNHDLSKMITNFSENLQDYKFIAANINKDSPVGFFHQNFGKSVEAISANLHNIGARIPKHSNKYSFACMFQLNMFSFPNEFVANFFANDVIFTGGVTKNVYKILNNVTNMNYLRDFEPTSPLITPGYTNADITTVKLSPPSWAINISTNALPLNYPTKYLKSDFYLTTAEMGDYMIKYQGNLYETNGWTKQKVISVLESEQNDSNIKYFTKDGPKPKNVGNNPSAATTAALRDGNAERGWFGTFKDNFRNAIMGRDGEAGYAGWEWWKSFGPGFEEFSSSLTGEVIGEVIGQFGGKLLSQWVSKGILNKFKEIINYKKFKRLAGIKEKEQQDQNNRGLQQREDAEKKQQEEEDEGEKDLTDFQADREKEAEEEVTKGATGEEGSDGMSKISGKGSAPSNPKPGIKPPKAPSEIEGSANLTPEPSGSEAAAQSIAQEGGEAAAAAESWIGYFGEVACNLGAAGAEVAMVVMAVISVIQETKRMWDDMCEHGDAYFQSQLGAKSFAVSMTQLLSGSSDPNCKATMNDDVTPEDIVKAASKPNCMKCGEPNAKGICPDDSPDFTGCKDPYQTNEVSKDGTPCSHCQLDDNCVPDDLCIPDAAGKVLFPCRCTIFTRLSSNRDALIKNQLYNNVIANYSINDIKDRNHKFTIVLFTIVILIFILLFTKVLFSTTKIN